MSNLPFPRSLPEFQKLFPDEESCAMYLERVRWADGFACPSCGERGEPYRFAGRPGVLRCRVCQRDTSLTAGTVMERTRTSLSTWFWAAYLLTSSTPGMSARQFARQIGVKRIETAFVLLHKLRSAMVRPNVDRIGGRESTIEMDETLVGGVTRGEGAGVHHMTYVVGAVEVCRRPPVDAWEPWEPSMHSTGICTCGATPNFKLDDQLRCSQCVSKPTAKALRRNGTYAGRLRLRVLPDRKATSLLAFARDSIEMGSTVRTDDWGGYAQLDVECGVRHEAQAEGGDPDVAERHLPLVHLVFSNFKAWLLGTHHSVSAAHLQAYANEFVFRFNRRFYPFNSFRSLLGLGAVTEAPTYAELYSHEWEHPTAAGPWTLTG